LILFAGMALSATGGRPVCMGKLGMGG
jgi:hypothetical protein